MTSTIITGKRTAEEIARAWYYKQSLPSPSTPPESFTPPDPQPPLEDKVAFWSIPGVHYRNQTQTVDLSKALLDSEATKTQDEWTQYSRQAQTRGDFYVGDFPLYHAVFDRLYQLRDDPAQQKAVQEAQTFIKSQMLAKWLMTLTRIQYKPKGKDLVIHNYTMPDAYTVDETMVGPDEWVKNSHTPQAYQALLSADNLHDINAVYQWLTGKDAYLWRVNSRPRDTEECIARFGANSDGAYLGCGRYPQYSNSGLGVRVVRKK